MKRLITSVLAIVLLVGLLTTGISATSYQELTTSQYMIDIIKDYEGFSAKPYWDSSHWAIGYGTSCGRASDGSDVPAEYWTGISEEHASELLNNYLKNKAEKEVNSFFKRIGRQPSQSQFDAIVDFTFNLGGGWMSQNTRVEEYLKNPTDEMGLVRALGAWCRTGNVNSSLCGRRIRESLVYLYGYYTLPYGNVTSNLKVVNDNKQPLFRYVIYNTDKGSLTSSGYSDAVEYFSTQGTYGSLLKPSYEDLFFAGWYREDGSKLSASNWVEYNERVYAKWTQEPMEEGKIFAGWYADEKFTTPLQKGDSTKGAYAKFVDEDVLSVKWQLSSGTNANSKKTDIRLLTTVDSLRYQLVGFTVEADGKPVKELTSSTVYKTIYGYTNGNNESYQPDIFSDESKYFMAHIISGIPQSDFDTEIAVTPKWVTLDGTEVTGKTLTFKVSDDKAFHNE